MGFNSTLLVLNDCLDQIAKDKDFGKKVEQTILRYPFIGEYGGRDISSGHCGNAATVLSCQHADATALLAVGGNCGTILSPNVGLSHYTEDDKERILREYANELGFYIVKKRKRK